MPSIQHLLETRFSVQLGWRLPRDWLEGRLELLRRFTIPSIAAQTTNEFTWLLLCDEATDPGVLEQLRTEERRLPPLRLAMTGSDRNALDVLRAAVDPDADVLITTRLDSDDSIADQYIAAVQEYAGSFHRSNLARLLVSFPLGYRLDVADNRLYTSRMTNNAFHSLIERPRSNVPHTVMSAGDGQLRSSWFGGCGRFEMIGRTDANWHSHSHLHQHYPTQQDESMHAWLMTIHGGNVINHITPDCRRVLMQVPPPGFTVRDAPPM